MSLKQSPEQIHSHMQISKVENYHKLCINAFRRGKIFTYKASWIPEMDKQILECTESESVENQAISIEFCMGFPWQPLFWTTTLSNIQYCHEFSGDQTLSVQRASRSFSSEEVKVWIIRES